MNSTLRFERVIPVQPAVVFRMFTNASALREWLCNRAMIEARPGGPLFVSWASGYYASGEYTRIEVPSQVEFTWHGRGQPGPGSVHLLLDPCTDDRGRPSTALILEHQLPGEGVPWQQAVDEIRSGWEESLERLAHVLIHGEDLRITRRPMIGVLFGIFNPEIAAQLGVPVTEGMCLSGVIDGLSAQRAGLQRDDVITALDGRPAPSFAEVGAALQGKRAGDRVQVTYYRGAEQRQAEMELAPRPMPEIPRSAQGLYDKLAQIYQDEQSELASVLQGVTEAEAAFKPAPNTLILCEVLAHRIHTERVLQAGVVEQIISLVSDPGGFNENPLAQVEATTAVYGSAAALEEAFHQARTETLELVKRLPEEFVQRKSSFWLMAYQLLAFPFHVHEHAEQVKAAVQMARGR